MVKEKNHRACFAHGLNTVCIFKKFPPRNLFFVGTVKKFQILEHRKVAISPFLQFLRIWFDFFKISGWKLIKCAHCKTLSEVTLSFFMRHSLDRTVSQRL